MGKNNDLNDYDKKTKTNYDQVRSKFSETEQLVGCLHSVVITIHWWWLKERKSPVRKKAWCEQGINAKCECRLSHCGQVNTMPIVSQISDSFNEEE